MRVKKHKTKQNYKSGRRINFRRPLFLFDNPTKRDYLCREFKQVLRLMDEDYSYEEALKIVLAENPNRNREDLEKELDQYI